MVARNEISWNLAIETHGRCGIIRYLEGQNEIRFDWEFTGGGSIVLIWGPKEEDWNATYPWASDRRRQIYERVAEGTIIQKAPSCKFAVNLQTNTIDIYKPSIHA